MSICGDKYWIHINSIGFYFIIFYLMLFPICVFLIFRNKLPFWVRVAIFLLYTFLYVIIFSLIVPLLIYDV